MQTRRKTDSYHEARQVRAIYEKATAARGTCAAACLGLLAFRAKRVRLIHLKIGGVPVVTYFASSGLFGILSTHFAHTASPSFGLVLAIFQQMLLTLSGPLLIPFLQSNMVCAGSSTIELRVRLIATSFFSAGAATLIQTTLGFRLCVLQGPSFAFLPPLFAFAAMPENKCHADLSTPVPEEEYTAKLVQIQGSLLIASLTFFIVGTTGLVGLFAKRVGPITITPLLIWLCLGIVPTMHEKMSLHWISTVTFGILIVNGIFLENFYVPIPYFSFSERSWKLARSRIFGQFPYLIAIAISWIICFLLTITGAEPEGGEARTDKNQTVAVLKHSPWFQIPYPGEGPYVLE